MKKSLLFVAAATLFVACSQDDVCINTPCLDQNADAISFSAYSGTATTRGTVTSVADFNQNGIGVFAFYQPAATGNFNTYKYATPDFMYNQKIEQGVTPAVYYDLAGYNAAKGKNLTQAQFNALPDAEKIQTPATYNGTWSYSPVKYWPNNTDDAVSFFAYAPYSSEKTWEDMGYKTDVDAKTLTVSFPIYQTVEDQKDHLYAQPVLNQSKQAVDANGSSLSQGAHNVKFIFSHITSQVNLYAGVEQNTASQAPTIWDDANTEIEINSIVFKSLSSSIKCTQSYVSSAWGNAAFTPAGTKQDITLTSEDFITAAATINNTNYNVADFKKLNEASSVMFLAPEQLGKVVITYTVKTTDGSSTQNSSTVVNTIEQDLSTLTLVQGKAYNLKFLIGMNSVKIVADIADWVDYGGTPYIQVPANN